MESKNSPKKKKGKIIWRGFIYRIIFLFALIIFSYAGFLFYKIYNFEKNIYVETQNPATSQTEKKTFLRSTEDFLSGNVDSLKGSDRERINILLLGMGGEGHKGEYLTDTIMVASINPETYETAFLSIPRDLYVKVPDYNIHTKINAVYTYALRNESSSRSEAISLIKKTVEDATDQPIDYYAALDFKGFKKVVDELDGIKVNVEKDIVDHKYPGPNYSYQTFKLDKGTHLLDGETALKYARVRHTEGGDFARAKRQQKVLAAARRKAFSAENFLKPSKISGLFNSLQDNLITNIKFSEVPAFLNLAKNINIYETTNKVLDAWESDSLLSVDHVFMGGVNAFVLVPRIGNYTEIQSLAKNIFQLDKIERQKEEIKKEEANILIVGNNSKQLQEAQKLLQRMNYEPEVETKEADNSPANCSKKLKIFENNNSQKLFTLNDLAQKFQTEVEKTKTDQKSDIIICVPDNSENLFHAETSSPDNFSEDSEGAAIVDEEGKVIYN
ncbi:MAG: LCP family protein [Patescibacteria group bacterium]